LANLLQNTARSDRVGFWRSRNSLFRWLRALSPVSVQMAARFHSASRFQPKSAVRADQTFIQDPSRYEHRKIRAF
jgi:hypothetical protein